MATRENYFFEAGKGIFYVENAFFDVGDNISFEQLIFTDDPDLIDTHSPEILAKHKRPEIVLIKGKL